MYVVSLGSAQAGPGGFYHDSLVVLAFGLEGLSP